MKKILYIAVSTVFLLSGCAEDFLTQKSLYDKSDESYYSTPDDIKEALAGAYSALPCEAGNNNPMVVAKMLSDDAFGGGGSNDDGFHSTDAFTLVNTEYYNELFSFGWPGILRVNMILKRFEQVEYDSENEKNQALGEAYFLRAFFYQRLSKFFGPVPLKLEPKPENLPRATPEEMYGQIAMDLKTAIEVFPATPYQDIPDERLGHATKWAAEALLGRVFLFYTGYYNQTSIALPDGTTMTKDDVIGYLVDCIENSGHAMLTDFRNNWGYSAVQRYPYTANNDLQWAGDVDLSEDLYGGFVRNEETIFSIKYSNQGGWGAPQNIRYCNQHSLYIGMRLQSNFPFGYGWGAGPVNPQLFESFEDGDIRRDGSIVNLNDPIPDDADFAANYVWNSDNNMHESGFMEKKYMPIFDSTGTRAASIFFIEYQNPDNNQLWNMQDDILIRFSDVLLMAAELGAPNAQTYFDDVRSRAGLGSKPVNLDNIKAERRHEFAFEGLRYFDLLRWGIAKESIEAANGLAITNAGVETTYNVTFPSATGGFLPIPQSEITLSNGVLEQTPGW